MLHDLMRNAVPAHQTDPNKFRTDCPFCGKENHFYFNIKTRSGICFKCMEKPIKLGGEFILTPEQKPTRDLDELREALKKTEPKSISMLKSGVDIDLFSESLDPKRHPKSMKYVLEERGLTLSDIKKYDIRSGKPYRDKKLDRTITKWQGRIVFPFYDEQGSCVYAIGRSYMGDVERKYVNVDAPKTDIVYGIDRVKNRECIICEGLLSAIAAEKVTVISSVCLLGKTISPFQSYRIRNKVDRVYLSLDGGVPEKQVRSVTRSLIRAGLEVWKVSLPGKGELDIYGNECTSDYDPDDLGDEYALYFNKAVRVRY